MHFLRTGAGVELLQKNYANIFLQKEVLVISWKDRRASDLRYSSQLLYRRRRRKNVWGWRWSWHVTSSCGFRFWRLFSPVMHETQDKRKAEKQHLRRFEVHTHLTY